MGDANPGRETWLLAVWPGMGNVAVGAGGYLVAKLGAALIHEMEERDLFDLQHIVIKDGIAQPGRLPRNLFFEWMNPDNGMGPNLLIFIGEAQPPLGGLAFCHRLLEYAAGRGVSRVFTLAAMASQLHPTDDPKVLAVATDRVQLELLGDLEVMTLKEGQVSGLNGVLLAAAAERGLPGACLLGELPYFAAGIPNPKASLAALGVFCALAKIKLDFSELKEQAEAVEHALVQLMEKLQENAEESGAEFTIPEVAREAEEDEVEAALEKQRKPPKLDAGARRQIEAMFQAAAADRSKAFQLKQELDRLGVFAQYEDRFLDLFRRGE